MGRIVEFNRSSQEEVASRVIAKVGEYLSNAENGADTSAKYEFADNESTKLTSATHPPDQVSGLPNDSSYPTKIIEKKRVKLIVIFIVGFGLSVIFGFLMYYL